MDPTAIAMLASGRSAAVRTGLAMLYARGLLSVKRQGALDRAGSIPADGDLLEKALFTGLTGPTGIHEVAEKPRVKVALRDTRRRLRAAGLLRRPWARVVAPLAMVVVPAIVTARLGAVGLLSPVVGVALVVAGIAAALWFVPRRTLAGERALRRLRGEHAGVVAGVEAGTTTAATMTAGMVGMISALYGSAALSHLLPRDVGAVLLDRRYVRQQRHNSPDAGPWTGHAAGVLDSNNPASPF